MYVIALTGDVGAGKSSMARAWHGQGATVLDADRIARDQWREPAIKEAAVRRWGKGILTEAGEVDLSRVSALGFATDEDYRFMCALIHPSTLTEMNRQIRSLRGWVVAEIPLLFEAGIPSWVDQIAYATASVSFRIERGRVRGWTGGEIIRRERWLLPSDTKKTRADWVFENHGSIEDWRAKACRMGELYRRMGSVVEIETYCHDKAEANKIAGALLEEKVVACCHFFAVSGRFRWEGSVEHREEFLLKMITLDDFVPRITKKIKELHSYQQPFMETRDIYRADPATLRWVVDSCRP